MGLELCVLGSGSSGNASLIRIDGRCMLIDAGFGPRAVMRRLSGTGVSIEQIGAICLTHLDTDHFTPSWLTHIAHHRTRLYCHRKFKKTLMEIVMKHNSVARLIDQIDSFESAGFSPLTGVECMPIALAHDQRGSHGFLIQAGGCRLGYATDLGHVPESLVEAFLGVDFLAIESNYDVDMQLESARPWHLKHRIMGSRGHLSNEQAFEAVQKIFDGTQRILGHNRLPRHVVLLHRSRQCNDVALLSRLFQQDQRVWQALTLSHQHEATEWLRLVSHGPLPGEQLHIFAA